MFEIPSHLILSKDNSSIVFYPEDGDGYIEYKLRLDTKNNFGLQKIYSQMNWRLEEGQSILGKKEAHYLLGITDNGQLGKLSKDEILHTFNIFSEIVTKCNADISNYTLQEYSGGCFIYAVIVKKEKNKFKELNVAFVGPSQHGKTTTISNLVYDQKDNGNGSIRKLIFKHEHEKVTGVTSSVKKEILGISHNKIINYSSSMMGQWEDVVNLSDKIINLIDLPGNTKFIRTTLFGLQSYDLDAIFIIIDESKLIDSDQILINIYINYALHLSIPHHIIYINDDLHTSKKDQIVISNKTGNNIHLIKNIFYSLQDTTHYDDTPDNKILFPVIEDFVIPDSGVVFSGILSHGTLELNKPIFLTNGTEYIDTTIKSIHKKQIDSQILYQKETGAVKLGIIDANFVESNKYLLITNYKHELFNSISFKLLWHSSNVLTNTTLCKQSLLFVNNNIISVSPIFLENSTYILNFENPVILPTLFFNNKHVCFLKNIFGIFIGELFNK